MSKRVFLFLQGHPSFFTRVLIHKLRNQGHSCRIINISISDWFYRVRLGANNFWGKLTNWPTYLEKYIDKHHVTDIIYYADQRPYHRIARALAYKRSLNVYTYEFGYLRPDWITIEKGGMGVFSHFPNDPSVIRKLAKDIKFEWPQKKYPYPFIVEAINEVFYNMAPSFMPYLFPRYVNDRFYHPLIEYPSYIPRLLRSKSNTQKAESVIEDLIESGADYFVVPLQLQADYQIRRASPYAHIREMAKEVISSFSRNAPADYQLVFKLHPLDNNMEKWPQTIQAIAEEFECSARVKVIDGGDLHQLLKHCKGNVLINSTTAISALQIGIPTKVLGIAIFDVAGMTDQRPLDAFWNTPLKPDSHLVQDFIKLMALSVQIKGNFFTKEGREVGAESFIKRVLTNDVNSYGAFVTPPPRLEQARKMGVPITFDEMEPAY